MTMKYPEIKKRCRLQHDPFDADMCGECIRAWEAKCEEFESKYEQYKKRINCDKCYGNGSYMTTYGLSPCERCNGKGIIWVEKWRHRHETD